MGTSDRLMEEYLDRYEGVKSEILNMTRFHENSDLSITHLGRSSMVKDHKSSRKKIPNIRTGVYNGQAIRWY